MRNKRNSHLLMLVLLLIWTVDAAAVSQAVGDMSQIFLLCFKTRCSIPVLAVFVGLKEGLRLPEKRHVPLLLLATLLGDILYFFCEYTAYKYLPIGRVTVLLGMLPAVSYLFDCAVTRARPRLKVMMPIAVSVIGLGMVVYSGAEEAGSGVGYLCCALCLALWIAYGRVAQRLDGVFSPEAVTLYESVAASLLMLPFALMNRPAALSAHDLWFCIVVMGIVTTGFGYII